MLALEYPELVNKPCEADIRFFWDNHPDKDAGKNKYSDYRKRIRDAVRQQDMIEQMQTLSTMSKD